MAMRTPYINQRQPKNPAEASFFAEAKGRGWTVTKRGWPDFFLVNEVEGKVALVEVKPTASHPLKKEQELVMRTLAAYGVPCFHWSPDGGFRKVS